MNDTTKVKFGILYILWIIIAWSFVAFSKFFFYSKISKYESISTIFKECIRFFVFIGPILVIIFYNIRKPWYKWLGLYGCKKGSVYKTLTVACAYTIISLSINVFVFHKTAHVSSIPYSFWFTAFSLSIIMEEMAFRGLLFYLFEKWNKNTIVIVTSLAFAAKHIPGWFFFPMEISPAGFIGDFFIVFLVGCILGYLYLATHSIWATSVLHSVNNLIVALFY